MINNQLIFLADLLFDLVYAFICTTSVCVCVFACLRRGEKEREKECARVRQRDP
jgi:hypothetical protein